MNDYFKPRKFSVDRIAFKMFVIAKRRGTPDYALELLLELIEMKLPIEFIHRAFLRILH